MSFLSWGKKKFYQPSIIMGLWAHNLLRTQRTEASRSTCVLLRSSQLTSCGQNPKWNNHHHVSEPYPYKCGLFTEWAKGIIKKNGIQRGQGGQPESLWFSLKLGWSGAELHGYSSPDCGPLKPGDCTFPVPAQPLRLHGAAVNV